jgi:hypothetical protein
MRPPWLKFVVALVAIWIVAGGIIFWARSSRPTPEKVIRYLDGHPIAGASARDQSRIVDEVAAELNGLTYEQRREVRMSRKLDGFFRSLSEQERARFLDLTLPANFKQMMDALNKMTHEKRKEFVDKALADMKKHQDDEVPPDKRQLDVNGQKIVNEGFRAFYSDASAETKMDVAPLIEQLQHNLQGMR